MAHATEVAPFKLYKSSTKLRLIRVCVCVSVSVDAAYTTPTLYAKMRPVLGYAFYRDIGRRSTVVPTLNQFRLAFIAALIYFSWSIVHQNGVDENMELYTYNN